MAFFGLQWVPQAEFRVKPSEANEVENAVLAESVRSAGYDAAVAQYYKLYAEYTEAHPAFLEKQSNMQSWKDYVDSKLPGFTGKEAEQVQAAAFALMESSPNYYTYTDSKEYLLCVVLLDMSEEAKSLVNDYYQFLYANAIAEAAEKELWDLDARMKDTYRVAELWKFEAVRAENLVTSLKSQEKEKRKKNAEMMKANAAFMIKLKRQNQQRMYATPASFRPGVSEVEDVSQASEFYLSWVQLDSILNDLGKLVDRSLPKKSNLKPEVAEGLLDKLFKPSLIPEKDFI